MMRKRVKAFVTMFAMMTAAIMTVTGLSGNVMAGTVENTINVSEVTAIMASNPMSVTDVHEWPSGLESVTDVYKVKFTLREAAYVKISVSSTVEYGNTEMFGTLKACKIVTAGGKQVGEYMGNGGIYAKKMYEQYLMLEQGTYYVVYEGKVDKYYGQQSSGNVSTVVEAQYVARTGNVTGISNDTMIPLVNGQTSSGYVSNLYGEQYFKFTINSKSRIAFDLSVAGTPSCYKPDVSYDLLAYGSGESYQKFMKPQDSSTFLGSPQYWLSADNSYVGTYPTSGNTGYVTLEKGTYYLKISRNSTKAANVGCIQVTPIIIPLNEDSGNADTIKNEAKKIKITKISLKRGKKKISGRTVGNATVSVRVYKKTYSVKSDSKGKFTVKLKRKLKKNQKITVTVKKNGVKKVKIYKVK